MIIAPGKKVAGTVIPKQAKDAMLQQLKETVVDEENHSDFEMAFSKLPENITYAEVRKEIISVLHRTQSFFMTLCFHEVTKSAPFQSTNVKPTYEKQRGFDD